MQIWLRVGGSDVGGTLVGGGQRGNLKLRALAHPGPDREDSSGDRRSGQVDEVIEKGDCSLPEQIVNDQAKRCDDGD